LSRLDSLKLSGDPAFRLAPWPSSQIHAVALKLIRAIHFGSITMFWSRTTKRPIYSALRVTGRELLTQWPTRTDARNDVRSPAIEPGGDVVWPENRQCRERAAGRPRSGVFLFGR